MSSIINNSKKKGGKSTLKITFRIQAFSENIKTPSLFCHKKMF